MYLERDAVGAWGEPQGGGWGKPLCTAGFIHFYRDPLLAILMNPIHANFAKLRLWECEVQGEVIHEPLKSGARDGKNGEGNSGDGDHRGTGGPVCGLVRAGVGGFRRRFGNGLGNG